MEQKDKYIRFDWAIKRLLRNKANFGVLEGFLTVLLGEEIHILVISNGKMINLIVLILKPVIVKMK